MWEINFALCTTLQVQTLTSTLDTYSSAYLSYWLSPRIACPMPLGYLWYMMQSSCKLNIGKHQKRALRTMKVMMKQVLLGHPPHFHESLVLFHCKYSDWPGTDLRGRVLEV